MAIQGPKLAGAAYISVDGQSLMLSGDLKYQVSGVKRETLSGQDSIHGYSEMPRAGKISISLRDSASVSMAAINAMTGVTVVLELANGKTIVGSNMWTVDDQEVDTGEAKADITWEGKSVLEA